MKSTVRYAGAPADHEPPVQQSVELFDQPVVGGFSRVVDTARLTGRQYGQQDLPGFFGQIVHALIDVPRLKDPVQDFADQTGAGNHVGLHAEGDGDGFQIAHGQGGEVFLEDQGIIPIRWRANEAGHLPAEGRRKGTMASGKVAFLQTQEITHVH